MAATEGLIWRTTLSWSGTWSSGTVEARTQLSWFWIPYSNDGAPGFVSSLTLMSWDGSDLRFVCGTLDQTITISPPITVELHQNMNHSAKPGGLPQPLYCDNQLYINGYDYGLTGTAAAAWAWPAALVRGAMVITAPWHSYNIGLDVDVYGVVDGWESDWSDAIGPANWNNPEEDVGGSNVAYVTWDSQTSFGWTNLRTVAPGAPGSYRADIGSRSFAIRPPVPTGHLAMSAGQHAIVRRECAGYADTFLSYDAFGLYYDDWSNWSLARVVERCADGELPDQRASLGMATNNLHNHPRGFTLAEDNGRLLLPEVDGDPAHGSTDQGATWSAWDDFVDVEWSGHDGYGLPWRRTAGGGWVSTQWQSMAGGTISAAHTRPGYIAQGDQDESDIVAWGQVIPDPRAGVRPVIPYAIQLRDGRFEVGAFHDGYQTAYRNGDLMNSNTWTEHFHTALSEHQISSCDWWGDPDGLQACVCYLPTTERIGVAWRGGPEDEWDCWTEVVAAIDRCCWPIIWQGRDGRWWVYVYREGAWEKYVAGAPGSTWSAV